MVTDRPHISEDYLNQGAGFSGKDSKKRIRRFEDALHRLVKDLAEYYPKTVLLFGSLARWFAGTPGRTLPKDMDILFVGNTSPFNVQRKEYGVPMQLNRLSVEQAVAIARSLRYDSKVAALSKLYSKNLVKQHSIDVIAACLMLGPNYNDFGIQQIEVGGIIDKRDYSVHQVLFGDQWWRRLRVYARERRGPWKRLSDRIVSNEAFEG
jgi:hypothetical protein